MPFDEEDNDKPSLQSQRIGLKKVSSQKSMFDNAPKKPTQAQLDKQVQEIVENKSSYKEQAAELSIQFKNMMKDKTLEENKNVFVRETEQEVLANMIKLAVKVNNDEYEDEGMGSLMWVILLLKTTLWQKDRINHLEYDNFELRKKVAELENKTELISRNLQDLDKAKKSE